MTAKFRSIRRLIFISVFLGSGILWLCGGLYLYLSPELPPVEALRDIKLQTPMSVYTKDGKLIGQFGEKKRNPLIYNDIPPLFIKALLAAEDDGFYHHHGIDFSGLLRAVTELLITGEKGSGGSTLTMQVARNYFLSKEKTFTRKFNEILLALEIERHLSKQEILTLYVNRVFLGHRAYGFEAAAQVYYGNHIEDLSLAQLAMMAGLPKAPSRYNPISNPERALIRRNWILGRMLNLGYISNDQHLQASEEAVSAEHFGAKLSFNAPYIAEMVRKEMLERYGLDAYNDGYKVYTTVPSELQISAQAAVINGLNTYDIRHGYRGPELQLLPGAGPDERPLEELWLTTLSNTPIIAEKVPAIVNQTSENQVQILLASGEMAILNWLDIRHLTRPYITADTLGPAPENADEVFSIGDLIRVTKAADGQYTLSQLPEAQAALVALNPDNGAILSLVGGLGFEQSKFNRATQAARQPGSNFKPFIYSAALAHGYTAASIINDAPVVFNDKALENTWRPENDGGRFYGPTRLRWALTKSRNLVSIRLLQGLGIRKAIDYVERFGFDKKLLAADLSLALGTHALTPLELVTAYASLANGGYRVEPFLIERIEDNDGNTVYSAAPATVCRQCKQIDEALDANTSAAIGDEELSMEDILSEEKTPVLPKAEQIMDERVAYIIDSILKDVIQKGTGRKAKVLKRSDIAGKTGTTNGPTDAWFSGYNRDIAVSSWLGFDQNNLLGRKEYGGSAALPIWIDYMRTALKGSPDLPRPTPKGIVTTRIDPDTGLLARPGQRNAIFEVFRSEYAPTETAGAKDPSGDLFKQQSQLRLY